MQHIIKQLTEEKKSLEKQLANIDSALVALGGGQAKVENEAVHTGRKKKVFYVPINAPPRQRLKTFRKVLESKMGVSGYTADEIHKMLIESDLLKKGKRLNLASYLIGSGGYYKVNEQYFLKYANKKVA